MAQEDACQNGAQDLDIEMLIPPALMVGGQGRRRWSCCFHFSSSFPPMWDRPEAILSAGRAAKQIQERAKWLYHWPGKCLAGLVSLSVFPMLHRTAKQAGR
jgi:hypothetical protein